MQNEKFDLKKQRQMSKESNFASLLPEIMQITNVVLLFLLLTSIFVSTEQMIFKYYVFKLWTFPSAKKLQIAL